MEVILLGIYGFFVWLIFYKFKWLPMATRWRQLARGPKSTRFAIGKIEVVRSLFAMAGRCRHECTISRSRDSGFQLVACLRAKLVADRYFRRHYARRISASRRFGRRISGQSAA